jgi:hypothetical protein
MLSNRKPITIDIGFIVAVVMFILVFGFVKLPVKDNSLILSAIEGVTTVTGLLFAVDGILITRFYSDKVTPWQKIRADCYLIALAISSVFIGGAYIAFMLDAPMLGFTVALIIFNISYAIAIALVFHFVYFFDLPDLVKAVNKARQPKSNSHNEKANQPKR